MTTSTWDNSKLGEQFPQCRTLKQIISSIEGVFSEQGEVICEIRVNGMLLDEDDEHKFADSSCAEIENLTVRSNTPASLIGESVVSACAFIPDLEAASLAAAEKFRAADLAPAQKAFNEVTAGCQWLFDTLMHIRGAASSIGAPIAAPEQWFAAEQLITRVVSELAEAYGAADYVLVADLLEYEITGALIVWRDVIEVEKSHRG